MAATNDLRHALKEVVRGERGGRKPRNQAEHAIRDGERLYRDRLLCGHLEEAARAFSALWNDKRTRKRLDKIELDENGQRAVELLRHELPAHGDRDTFRARFIQTIRNHWAFHYLEHVYTTALANACPDGEILVTDAAGLSRYLVIDQMIHTGVTDAARVARVTYDEAMRRVISLAGALGTVVDQFVVGLLTADASNITRGHTMLHLDRGLAKGRREARARAHRARS